MRPNGDRTEIKDFYEALRVVSEDSIEHNELRVRQGEHKNDSEKKKKKKKKKGRKEEPVRSRRIQWVSSTNPAFFSETQQ